jgi:hypothetical protein
MDEDACWRWAFKKAYGRRPKVEELTRYKYWHGISRRDGFDASGPWECGNRFRPTLLKHSVPLR